MNKKNYLYLENILQKKKDSKYSNIFYYIDTITIWIKFYGIEFLIRNM